jgi:prephenate dehydrogenase
VAVQITIIGMGQIGTSIGLALSGKADLLRRVGHDRQASIAHKAQKMGALDQVETNLPRSVEQADLVLLCLPLDQVRETLGYIAQDLKEGAVVMDTCTNKEAIAQWTAELLPAGRHYVGLTPVINPVYLHDVDTGIEAARADLFQKGLMAIASPPQTDSAAIKLAADLARLLGAQPLFSDTLEIDGLMAATSLLPQLLAAALVNTTADQPGWREGRKFAGRAYAEASAPVTLMGSPQTLSASVLANSENTLRMLDSLQATLATLREDIAGCDAAALEERLKRAVDNRQKWLAGRSSGEWLSDGIPPVEVTETPGSLSRLFGIGRKTGRKS